MRVSKPQLSVIVPTRNECANIAPLIDALSQALHDIPTEIIMVDDSDDATPEVIKHIMARADTDLQVRLVHRQPGPDRAGGLATAVSQGFQLAQARYVAVLDADLQHPPERLRALYDEAIAGDADVVLATRYRAGGSYDGLDGFSRRLISVGLKWVAKIVFPDQLMRVSDPLGGFFLVRRSIIKGVTLRPIGYKIALELLIRCHWVRLVEVPYHFQARTAGESKANFKQGVLVLRHMWRLVREVPAAARFWKFCLVGASGVLVNFALFWLALHTNRPLWPAWIVATEASVLSNFFINSLLTWRDVAAQGKRDWVTRAALYHAAVLPGVAISFAVFAGLTLNHYQTPYFAQAAGVIAGVIVSYLLSRNVVFAPREDWQRIHAAQQQGFSLEDALAASTDMDLEEEPDTATPLPQMAGQV